MSIKQVIGNPFWLLCHTWNILPMEYNEPQRSSQQLTETRN